MIISKIIRFLNGYKISRANGISKVKIRDSATTYIRICKNSIQGEGSLLLNPNAVNRKESSKLRIDDGGVLIINGTVSLYTGFNIHIGKGGMLRIEDGTFINENSLISIADKCEIGKQCAISNNVTIIDSNFHEINGGLRSRGIKIGNKVLIGLNTTVLKGSIINDNCVIGAESVVVGEIEKNSIATGRIAKRINECVGWK